MNSGKSPLLFVAAGAIFLFVGIGLGAKALSSFSDGPENVFLSVRQSSLYSGVSGAQVRADEATVSESPELVLLGNSSIIATVPSMTVTPKVLGAILGTSSIDARNTQEITHYIVEQDDTIESVAEKFAISQNTIVWANDLTTSSLLHEGDEVVVLPVSGALHLVRPNDTLSEIALWYRADIDDILDFNDLDSAGDVFVGDILVIPGGRKPSTLPNGRLTPLANSYFILPVPRDYKMTQGLHPFNAVDLANGTCGGPVYTAAGGMAQVVGYNNGLGNFVRILHPNGVVTVYAHLSGQAISTGEKALQGQIIGYIGHTGYTIPSGSGGCHLHFEVRGAANPFAK